MLSEKQILEVREHLEKAQSPVFFYDNDADGFCSYVLLSRFIGRGKGVAIRSHPDVDEGYAKKAQELNADYVFILDRPILGEKFVEEVSKMQLPIVWIDHHPEDGENYEGVFVYNPARNDKKKSNEPVSYLSYKITGREEDAWIALMGCIADHYLPDFVDEFIKRYPEYWSKNIKKPFDAYYKTEIGRLARVIGFGLKDSVTHVVQLQNFLIGCKSPADMFLEIESSKPFARKYREVKKKYDSLVNQAKENVGSKLIFFNYGGELSMSADISNELSYLYPKHVVVAAYSSGPITNMSLRGENVRGILEKVLALGFEGATGGGHRDAVGSRIQTADLERFKKEIEERIK
jgi:single-stranded DNA-specific DHH superfamily exonuclease